MKHLTEEEAEKFTDERCQFLDYKNIEEYVEDIIVCLIYSSWHYTEECARQQCKDRMNFIEGSFARKEAADDCAADVGYNCG